MLCLQAKSDEVSHVNATWEQHENSMIDAQIKMTDMQAVTSAARKAEAEALAAKIAAEATLAAQNDMLERLRSRMAGVEAEMDGLRSQVTVHSLCTLNNAIHKPLHNAKQDGSTSCSVHTIWAYMGVGCRR